MRVTGTVCRLMSSLMARGGLPASHSRGSATAQQLFDKATALRAGRTMPGPAQVHSFAFGGSTPVRPAWAPRVLGSERNSRAAALGGAGTQCARSGSSSGGGMMVPLAAAAHAVARRRLAVTAHSLASEEAPSSSTAAAAPVTANPTAAAAAGMTAAAGAAAGGGGGGWSPDFEAAGSNGNGVFMEGDASTRPGSNGSSSGTTTTTSSSSRGFSTSTSTSSDNSGSNGNGVGSDSAASAATTSTTTSSSGAPLHGAPAQQQQQQQQLALLCGASMLPHPDKAHRGGEDAFFIADPPRALGVADGVGGWAEVGVDAGAYARLLMAHAKEEAEAVLSGRGGNGSSSSSNNNSGAPQLSSSSAAAAAAPTVAPHDVLERAYYRTNVQGSSTACVVAINGATLVAANLGDSGFVLVRDGKAAFQSPQQVHSFNFPYQLGSADGGASDHPGAAMRIELAVRPGDILVCGTDGLWDNVFADEAAAVVARCRAQGDTPEAAAHTLCRYARMRATDPKHHSPFSYAAMQAGYVFLGGKLDDITVVVAYVAQAAAKL